MKTHAELTTANTFSICAVRPDIGEAGVAVASRCLAVGALVPFARPGVGAIASQACVNPDYGPKGLELLAGGFSPKEVIERLTREDLTVTEPDTTLANVLAAEGLTEEGVDFARDVERERTVWFTSRIRQLGVVDRHGRSAAFTGTKAQAWAGSITGEGFSCQGNLLTGQDVLEAMVDAFEQRRSASMADQLLAALLAGDQAGGDRRGKQAAGVLIVRDRAHWTGSDRRIDLRVDDHTDPVAELARIMGTAGLLGG